MALSSDLSNSGMRFRNKLDSIDEGECDNRNKESMKAMMDDLCQEDNPNILVYKKMEVMLEQLQDPSSGITVRTVKNFISKIPSVFTGSDLISWIMKNLDVEDNAEAIHLANLLGVHGYIFPIDDHILCVKNDGTYYRFQTPCFWPSKCPEPENTDYAVYLCKRTMQNKQRLELVDYEAEHLARLQKVFSRKWEFIFIQADAQAKVDKKRDKLERKVLDSQERAFWDVHRPAPGCINATEVDVKKTCRNLKNHRNNQYGGGRSRLLSSSSSSSHQASESDYLNSIESLKAELEKLKASIERRRIKVSKVVESYVTYQDQCKEMDACMHPTEPSNPWISDSTELWDQENNSKDVPSRRVKRWGISFRELLTDAAGREHFRKFLEKEFSAENLKFWEACQKLKGVSKRMVEETVLDIYNEYLSPTAHDAVNVDCRVAELVRGRVTGHPDRYCFEEAESHIHLLMKNDCYNRYLRSDMFKEYLAGNKKKSKKGFATEVKRLRELTKTQGFVNLMQQQQPPTRTTMQQVVHALRASHLSKQLLEQKQQALQKLPESAKSPATSPTNKAMSGSGPKAWTTHAGTTTYTTSSFTTTNSDVVIDNNRINITKNELNTKSDCCTILRSNENLDENNEKKVISIGINTNNRIGDQINPKNQTIKSNNNISLQSNNDIGNPINNDRMATIE